MANSKDPKKAGAPQAKGQAQPQVGQAGKKRKKSSMGWQWRVLSIAFLLTSLAFLPTTIMFAIGMVPSLVAFYVDKTAKKSIAICVGSLNACGNIPFLLKLWTLGHEMDVTMKIVTDPLTIIVMWSTAVLGWIIHDYVPPLYAATVRSRGENRLEEIQNEQKRLIKEWGQDVSGEKALAGVRPTINSDEADELLR